MCHTKAPACGHCAAVGEVDLYFATVPAALPLVEAKKLRALGVTSARRSPLMRDVPAIAEAGLKGYETSTWHGILAPAGTSPEIVVKLNAEIGARPRPACG